MRVQSKILVFFYSNCCSVHTILTCSFSVLIGTTEICRYPEGHPGELAPAFDNFGLV